MLPELFLVEDGLHPTRKCYELWTSIIKPVLLQRFGLAKIAITPTIVEISAWQITASRWCNRLPHPKRLPLPGGFRAPRIAELR
jgi:hypothetical protein